LATTTLTAQQSLFKNVLAGTYPTDRFFSPGKSVLLPERLVLGQAAGVTI